METASFGRLPYNKHPSSVLVIDLDFFNWLARFWEPNREYTATEHVRPANGRSLSFEATTGGLSGSKEPAWPTTIADTVSGGGALVWTARAAGTLGLIASASSPVLTVFPAGTLTATSPSVVRNTAVTLTLSAGTDKQDYRVECQVTAGSRTLLGSIIIPVRVK